MKKTFEGSAAWITGGGSGIGKAVALELARRGAQVAVSGRREQRLVEVTEAIEQAGGRAAAFVCDVTDEQEIESTAARVFERFGRLDVAVANAGFGVMGRIEDLSSEDWRRQLNVNVVGLALTAKHALPLLRETKGRLGLVGSAMGFFPVGGYGAYAASKYAVRAIGETLAIELTGSGVSCTSLHPGFVESEIGQVDNRGTFREDRRDRRPKALLWKTEDAARVMVDALHARKREFVFTTHGRVAAFVGRHFSSAVVMAQRTAARRTER